MEMPETTFWERLEESSQDVGLPCGLSDIARELDIWPSAVQKWQDGIGLPAQKNTIQLAKNRGVKFDWLLYGVGPKLAESAMDAATRELLALWNSLPQDAQERLLHAARYERAITPPEKPPEPPSRPRPTPPFSPTKNP